MSMPLSFPLVAVPAKWTAGDRISIPSAILHAIHPSLSSNDMDSIDPIYFELHFGNHHRIGVGTRDFANPDVNTALVPANLYAQIVQLNANPMETEQIPIILYPVNFPKATSVSLRPTVDSIAYLDVPDVRPVLESHLRNHHATLTQSCSITISSFLPTTLSMVDLVFEVTDLQPNVMASVINTDIDLTILPVTDDLDELTLLTTKYHNHVSACAPQITHANKPILASIPVGHYQYFTLHNITSLVPNLPATSPVWLHVQCTLTSPLGDVDLFFHPYLRPTSSVYWSTSNLEQVAYPKTSFTVNIMHALQSHNWPDMFLSVHAIPIRDEFGVPIPEANPTHDQGISIQLIWSLVVADHVPVEYLSDDLYSGSSEIPDSHEQDGKVQCNSCNSWIASSSLVLHNLHCARNTTKCKLCNEPMTKSAVHVHCSSCSQVTTILGMAWRHQQIAHNTTPTLPCASCNMAFTTHQEKVTHQAYTCPFRIEWCRFCRTHAPVEGEASLVHQLNYGLMTLHQVQCAARTIDCSKCGKPVQKRDVAAHMALHQREKQSQPVPVYVCANHLCGRYLPRMNTVMGKFGLCSPCFGPLYSHKSHGQELHSTQSAADLRLVIHRYFTQATEGCKFTTTCSNTYCKNSDPQRFKLNRMDRTDIAVHCMSMAKRLVSPESGVLPEAWFCIPNSYRVSLRRGLAEELAYTHAWEIGWCLYALVCTESLAFPDLEDESLDLCCVTEETRVRWVTLAYSWLDKEAPRPE